MKTVSNWFGCLIVILTSVSSYANETLSVASDPWCPFTCDSKSDSPGILIEILKIVYEPEIKIAYKEVSWSRAVSDAREGKYVAIAGALIQDAPDFIFPKTSLVKQESCFYVNKDSSSKYKNNESLVGKIVGLVSDYNYGKSFDDFVKKKNGTDKFDYITGTDTTLRLFLKLNSNRNEIIIEDKSVASYVLANSDGELKKIVTKEVGCLPPQSLYIAFTPKDKIKSLELVKRFDNEIKKPSKAKKIQDLFKKYGLSR